MNKIYTLDIDSKIVIFAIIMLIACLIYIIYIFFFIVSPSIFDAIKDYLPIKIKNYKRHTTLVVCLVPCTEGTLG